MSLMIHSDVFFVYYVRGLCDARFFQNFFVNVELLPNARRVSDGDTVLIKSIKVASREDS